MKSFFHYSAIGVSIAALLVSGCSSDSSSTGEASGVTTIEFWHVNSNDWGGNEVKKIVDNFNAENKSIQVVSKYIPNQYQGVIQQAQAAIAGGNPPDVSMMGYNYVSYVNGSLPYTPIEEVAKLDEKEPNFIKDNFLPNVVDLSRADDGKLVGLSFGLSNPVLYYNADMLKQVGWNPDKPPATWEEIKELSKKVKDQTGNYGLYIQEPPDNWATFALAKSNGGNWLEKNGKELKVTVDSPEVVEVYQMIGDMVKEKLAFHGKQEEGQQAFGNGKIAMYYTTIGRMGGIKQQSKFDLRTSKSPTFGSKPRSIPAGGNTLVVFSKDKKKQKAAWEFIKHLQSPESLAIWVQGTGYLPPREGVEKDPKGADLKKFLDENPLMKPAIEQKDAVVQWANFPGDNGLQAEQALIDARDQILNGTSTAQDAMSKAAAKIRELLK
ncbi:ABC transporter substrate-binding protein [Paenibacillus sp. J31TS4]|uniref:ABC transporter substrate-binding protein n=1 Tax=Paenibacillus sp. J31TS4 TaxID=2807195 RepID=UPI001B12C06B|nr:ABC transporter substrate-binding protein [Paenibacillus sp. J31TS4]GIP39725.1 ABC transporter substrate-binding protein [Paenibacillus sp. J31TS4]